MILAIIRGTQPVGSDADKLLMVFAMLCVLVIGVLLIAIWRLRYRAPIVDDGTKFNYTEDTAHVRGRRLPSRLTSVGHMDGRDLHKHH